MPLVAEQCEIPLRAVIETGLNRSSHLTTVPRNVLRAA
jgi:hypothetical protein